MKETTLPKLQRNEPCRYCGDNCPNDHEHMCDGYSGDIDNLYEGTYQEPNFKLKVEMLAELSKHTVIPKEHEDYVIDALIKAFNSIPTEKVTT